MVFLVLFNSGLATCREWQLIAGFGFFSFLTAQQKLATWLLPDFLRQDFDSMTYSVFAQSTSLVSPVYIPVPLTKSLYTSPPSIIEYISDCTNICHYR